MSNLIPKGKSIKLNSCLQTSNSHHLSHLSYYTVFLHEQTTNFDLTKNYLDLIVTYISMMLLLARVADRKAMLGLFNTAHELSYQKRYVIRDGCGWIGYGRSIPYSFNSVCNDVNT